MFRSLIMAAALTALIGCGGGGDDAPVAATSSSAAASSASGTSGAALLYTIWMAGSDLEEGGSYGTTDLLEIVSGCPECNAA